MKALLLVGLIILQLAFKSKCQEIFWPITAQKFFVDAVGNFYFLNKNEITKYNSSRVFVGRYSNKQLGNDFDIDVTNPLKVLIYSQSLSTIIFLDNMMSKSTTEINLNEAGLGTVTLVCSSNNNGFWAYNPVNFQLIRFDENLNKVAEINFINQITGYDLYPNFMREYNNLLYVNDPAIGVLVFDIFGTYFKTLPFKGINFFTIENDQLFFRESNKIISYHLKNLTRSELTCPPDALFWTIRQKKLYLLTDKGLLEVLPQR